MRAKVLGFCDELDCPRTRPAYSLDPNDTRKTSFAPSGSHSPLAICNHKSFCEINNDKNNNLKQIIKKYIKLLLYFFHFFYSRILVCTGCILSRL